MQTRGSRLLVQEGTVLCHSFFLEGKRSKGASRASFSPKDRPSEILKEKRGQRWDGKADERSVSFQSQPMSSRWAKHRNRNGGACGQVLILSDLSETVGLCLFSSVLRGCNGDKLMQGDGQSLM